MGTTSGIIKCGVVNRLEEEDRWSKEFILNMQGFPWQPVPGKPGQHILVEINENGETMDEEDENETPLQEDKDIDEEDPDYQKQKNGSQFTRVTQGNFEVWRNRGMPGVQCYQQTGTPRRESGIQLQ